MMLSRAATVFSFVALGLLPTMASSDNGSNSGNSSPLCLVPVRNGEPTKLDLYEAWRMTTKVVAVPGLPRPIIFPLNRGGVWTIDANGAFVPFGGSFPDDPLNEYTLDTSTGDIIGVSWKLGVFRLRRGETRFERLYPADSLPFVHPYSAAYVARFGGTVISDRSGLFLFRSSGQVERMQWDAKVGGQSPGRIFDLPQLNLLLLETEGHVFARDDNGNLTVFDEGFGGVEAAHVTDDGTILLEQREQILNVPWPPKDPNLPATQQRVTAKNKDDNFYATSQNEECAGTMPGNLRPVTFSRPIEFARGVMVSAAGMDGLYTHADGTWAVVDKSVDISAVSMPLSKLPVETMALLVTGKNGLYLLVDKTDARAAQCL